MAAIRMKISSSLSHALAKPTQVEHSTPCGCGCAAAPEPVAVPSLLPRGRRVQTLAEKKKKKLVTSPSLDKWLHGANFVKTNTAVCPEVSSYRSEGSRRYALKVTRHGAKKRLCPHDSQTPTSPPASRNGLIQSALYWQTHESAYYALGALLSNDEAILHRWTSWFAKVNLLILAPR